MIKCDTIVRGLIRELSWIRSIAAAYAVTRRCRRELNRKKVAVRRRRYRWSAMPHAHSGEFVLHVATSGLAKPRWGRDDGETLCRKLRGHVEKPLTLDQPLASWGNDLGGENKAASRRVKAACLSSPLQPLYQGLPSRHRSKPQ